MSGFSFGSTPSTSANVGMTGTPAATFGFGSSFGSSATTSTAAPATNFSMGSTVTAGGISFGQSAANTNPTFGSQPTSSVAPTFGAPTTGLSFNPPASTSLGFGGLGGTSATPNFAGLQGFGTPATTSTSTGFNLNIPASSAAPAFNLGGGFSTTPQTSLSSGFGGLGGTTTTSLNFGLGSTATSVGGGFLGATSKPLLSLPTSAAPTAATSTFVGLGGVDVTLSSTSGAAGSTVEQSADKAARENILPPEILQTIEDFKYNVKQQKMISTEFSRISQKPMHKVANDIENLKQSLVAIKNHIQCRSVLAEKLRRDSTKTLQQAEMAQLTQDTPIGLQMEHLAPDEYFAEITSNIERELQLYKHEIGNMERLLNHVFDPSILNKEEVVQAVRRLHEIFVALATKLQTLHSGVEQQKEQFLSLRRQLLQDTSDVFLHLGLMKPDKVKPAPSRHKESSGPPLFSAMGGSMPPLMYNSLANQLGTQTGARTAFPAQLSFGLGQSSSLLGGNTSSSFSTNLDASENRPFQLQQPPVGNKRGKR